jgi:hypothetical protein
MLSHILLTNTSLREAINMYKHNPLKAIKQYGHIKYFDTSRVTDLSKIFKDYDCDYDLSLWNVLHVKTTHKAFENNKLFSGKLNNWNLVSNEDSSYMFNGCLNLVSLPDTFHGYYSQNCEGMFKNCIKYYNHNHKHQYNMKNVNMGFMFEGCYNLQPIPILNDGSITEFHKKINNPNIYFSTFVKSWQCKNMFKHCFVIQKYYYDKEIKSEMFKKLLEHGEMDAKIYQKYNKEQRYEISKLINIESDEKFIDLFGEYHFRDYFNYLLKDLSNK